MMPCRPRRRPVAAVIVVALLAMAGCGRGVSATADRGVALGAFLGSDAAGVDGFDAFASWLGVTPLVGRSYLPGGSWDDIEGPDWLLDPWSAWRRGHGDRVFVLNVPMVAPNEPPLDDRAVAGLLRQGVSGRYDAHFRTLAQRLASVGVESHHGAPKSQYVNAAVSPAASAGISNGSSFIHNCLPAASAG
jgi:hypothetical protein